MEYLALENIVPKILEVSPSYGSLVDLGIFKLKLNLAGIDALILHFQ
jgi:hypothetical protein